MDHHIRIVSHDKDYSDVDAHEEAMLSTKTEERPVPRWYIFFYLWFIVCLIIHYSQNLKIIVRHPDLWKVKISSAFMQKGCFDIYFKMLACHSHLTKNAISSARRWDIVRFVFHMQNKEQQNLAGLSACGAPNRDCEPWQSNVDVHDRDMLSTEEKPTKKRALSREKKKCFSLIYKTGFELILQNYFVIALNVHTYSAF